MHLNRRRVILNVLIEVRFSSLLPPPRVRPACAAPRDTQSPLTAASLREKSSYGGIGLPAFVGLER